MSPFMQAVSCQQRPGELRLLVWVRLPQHAGDAAAGLAVAPGCVPEVQVSAPSSRTPAPAPAPLRNAQTRRAGAAHSSRLAPAISPGALLVWLPRPLAPPHLLSFLLGGHSLPSRLLTPQPRGQLRLAPPQGRRPRRPTPLRFPRAAHWGLPRARAGTTPPCPRPPGVGVRAVAGQSS